MLCYRLVLKNTYLTTANIKYITLKNLTKLTQINFHLDANVSKTKRCGINNKRAGRKPFTNTKLECQLGDIIQELSITYANEIPIIDLTQMLFEPRYPTCIQLFQQKHPFLFKNIFAAVYTF